jgi:hypothetical protein
MQEDEWIPKVDDSKCDMPSSECCRTVLGGWCVSLLAPSCNPVYTAWMTSAHHLSFRLIMGFYETEKMKPSQNFNNQYVLLTR